MGCVILALHTCSNAKFTPLVSNKGGGGARLLLENVEKIAVFGRMASLRESCNSIELKFNFCCITSSYRKHQIQTKILFVSKHKCCLITIYLLE